MSVPQVALPKLPYKDGILVPDSTLTTDAARSSGRSAWAAYGVCRVRQIAAAPKTSGFSVGIDGSVTPTGSYHSLDQELECLHATLTELRILLANGTASQENLDPSLKILARLEKDGVLSCWVLLNAADQGIRFDYPNYRKNHRDALLAYVDQYIVQRTP